MLASFGSTHDPQVMAFALLALRVTLGATIAAHGLNKFFGGGRLAGTAGWFESIGMRPGHRHALMAATTEVGAGTLLCLGLLTPFGAAGVIGLMTVAIVTVHRRNGFFVFRPGQGIEYCLTLAVVAGALSATGPGAWSVDHAIGWHHSRLLGLGIGVVLGVGGAALQLATSWRPPREPAA